MKVVFSDKVSKVQSLQTHIEIYALTHKTTAFVDTQNSENTFTLRGRSHSNNKVLIGKIRIFLHIEIYQIIFRKKKHG